MFEFDIKAQEIYCMVSIADKKKIIDGSDDRVMSMLYSFALSPHESPDLETFGHRWEVVSLEPKEMVKMLI